MAVVEAMVVYYLRRLFALQYAAVFTPGRFSFPHAYLRHEQIREAATIVMLLVVAWLAGRGLLQKLAYFLFAFGVWDIGYYVALKIMLDWPASLGTRDLLFLSPASGGRRCGSRCSPRQRSSLWRRSCCWVRGGAERHGWRSPRRDLQHPQRDRLGRTRLVALSRRA